MNQKELKVFNNPNVQKAYDELREVLNRKKYNLMEQMEQIEYCTTCKKVTWHNVDLDEWVCCECKNKNRP